MSKNKYDPKDLPGFTAEPLSCVGCKRQNGTLLNAGSDEKGRAVYACTDCAGTRRKLSQK